MMAITVFTTSAMILKGTRVEEVSALEKFVVMKGRKFTNWIMDLLRMPAEMKKF